MYFATDFLFNWKPHEELLMNVLFDVTFIIGIKW